MALSACIVFCFFRNISSGSLLCSCQWTSCVTSSPAPWASALQTRFWMSWLWREWRDIWRAENVSHCLCPLSSSSICDHSGLIYFNLQYKPVIIMQLLLTWVRSFSASAQVKTSSAWLEQEYPHVSVLVWISEKKVFKNIKHLSVIISLFNFYFCNPQHHLPTQRLGSLISAHQVLACMQTCRNITCLTQRPSSRSITLRCVQFNQKVKSSFCFALVQWQMPRICQN